MPKKYDELMILWEGPEYVFKSLIEKAAKWDKVREIAKTSPPCECPLWDDEKEECTSEHAGCVFSDVIDALEGKETVHEGFPHKPPKNKNDKSYA